VQSHITEFPTTDTTWVTSTWIPPTSNPPTAETLETTCQASQSQGLYGGAKQLSPKRIHRRVYRKLQQVVRQVILLLSGATIVLHKRIHRTENFIFYVIGGRYLTKKSFVPQRLESQRIRELVSTAHWRLNSPSGGCEEQMYQDANTLFHPLQYHVYIVPGDNEYNGKLNALNS
jgi:hypothetical protein